MPITHLIPLVLNTSMISSLSDLTSKKMPEASFAGCNIKSGDLLTAKPVSTTMTNAQDTNSTTLHYDALLEVNDAGVAGMK